jgi:hypothetical protein
MLLTLGWITAESVKEIIFEKFLKLSGVKHIDSLAFRDGAK